MTQSDAAAPGLGRRFAQDLAEMAEAFISAFQLKYSADEPPLSDPLLRWMDYVLRYIAPKPRELVMSSLFPKALPAEIHGGLRLLLGKLARGEDVNAYQTSQLSRLHDVSGRRKQQRTDLLFADWGIHHLHVTDKPVEEGRYSARSAWLLFCCFRGDQVAILDVRPHGQSEDFADQSLVEQMLRDWPDCMERYRAVGILPSHQAISPSDRMQLRKAGINVFVEFGGHVFMAPGLGITSAGTPIALTRSFDRVRHHARNLARFIEEPENGYLEAFARLGVPNPVFRLQLTPDGLAVYDEISNAAVVLPRSGHPDAGILGELHDMFAPAWALTRLLAANGLA